LWFTSVLAGVSGPPTQLTVPDPVEEGQLFYADAFYAGTLPTTSASTRYQFTLDRQTRVWMNTFVGEDSTGCTPPSGSASGTEPLTELELWTGSAGAADHVVVSDTAGAGPGRCSFVDEVLASGTYSIVVRPGPLPAPPPPPDDSSCVGATTCNPGPDYCCNPTQCLTIADATATGQCPTDASGNTLPGCYNCCYDNCPGGTPTQPASPTTVGDFGLHVRFGTPTTVEVVYPTETFAYSSPWMSGQPANAYEPGFDALGTPVAEAGPIANASEVQVLFGAAAPRVATVTFHPASLPAPIQVDVTVVQMSLTDAHSGIGPGTTSIRFLHGLLAGSHPIGATQADTYTVNMSKDATIVDNFTMDFDAQITWQAPADGVPDAKDYPTATFQQLMISDDASCTWQWGGASVDAPTHTFQNWAFTAPPLGTHLPIIDSTGPGPWPQTYGERRPATPAAPVVPPPNARVDAIYSNDSPGQPAFFEPGNIPGPNSSVNCQAETMFEVSLAVHLQVESDWENWLDTMGVYTRRTTASWRVGFDQTYAPQADGTWAQHAGSQHVETSLKPGLTWHDAMPPVNQAAMQWTHQAVGWAMVQDGSRYKTFWYPTANANSITPPRITGSHFTEPP